MNSGRQRTVWLSDETWEKLRAIAFAHRCSIAKVIRAMIDKEIERRKG